MRTVAMTRITHRMHMYSNMMHRLDMIGQELISELFVSSRKAFQEYGYTISILLQAIFGKHICRPHSVTTRMEGCRLQVESNYVLEGCTGIGYGGKQLETKDNYVSEGYTGIGYEGQLYIRMIHRYRIWGTVIYRTNKATTLLLLLIDCSSRVPRLSLTVADNCQIIMSQSNFSG